MRPLELMLTCWLVLYPELMGIYEDNPDYRAEARRIRGLFVAPLLQSQDLFSHLRGAPGGLQGVEGVPEDQAPRPPRYAGP